jgi:hypothetical protein
MSIAQPAMAISRMPFEGLLASITLTAAQKKMLKIASKKYKKHMLFFRIPKSVHIMTDLVMMALKAIPLVDLVEVVSTSILKTSSEGISSRPCSADLLGGGVVEALIFSFGIPSTSSMC